MIATFSTETTKCYLSEVEISQSPGLLASGFEHGSVTFFEARKTTPCFDGVAVGA